MFARFHDIHPYAVNQSQVNIQYRDFLQHSFRVTQIHIQCYYWSIRTSAPRHCWVTNQAAVLYTIYALKTFDKAVNKHEAKSKSFSFFLNKAFCDNTAFSFGKKALEQNISMKAVCPSHLSIHQGLALNPEQSKTRINTQCEIVIITVKTCVVFQSFETNQVLSCFWIWQAKILHGSRTVVVVFLYVFRI